MRQCVLQPISGEAGQEAGKGSCLQAPEARLAPGGLPNNHRHVSHRVSGVEREVKGFATRATQGGKDRSKELVVSRALAEADSKAVGRRRFRAQSLHSEGKKEQIPQPIRRGGGRVGG